MTQVLRFRYVVVSILVALMLTPVSTAERRITVATYNIKFLDAEKLPTQGERETRLETVIEQLNADVIGLQEINDRDALAAVFDTNEWALIIDDDSGDAQDLAIAVRKSSLTVSGVNPDMDADDDNFLFPSSTDNTGFPRRRDVLAVQLNVKNENASFVLLVHHAKARIGGRANTTRRRVAAAQELVRKMEQRFDETDFILVGDFNDTPDDASLNVLETGDPNASTEMENSPGEFLINLTEPAWAAGYITHGFNTRHVEGDRLVPIDSGARLRNFELRNSNDRPRSRDLRNLLDQILIPSRMLPRYVVGSAQVFDGTVAVEGPKKERPSDHLPVWAMFEFGGPIPDEPAGPIIKIVSLLPDPAGPDRGKEKVTLENISASPMPLAGWTLRDRARNEFALSGTIQGNDKKEILLPANKLPLNQSGDTVSLCDPDGREGHEVTYSGGQVRVGVAIDFD